MTLFLRKIVFQSKYPISNNVFLNYPELSNEHFIICELKKWHLRILMVKLLDPSNSIESISTFLLLRFWKNAGYSAKNTACAR